MTHRPTIALLIVALASFGCGDDGPSTDSNAAASDAAMSNGDHGDAETMMDAGSSDVGSTPDATEEPTDLGPPPDLGPLGGDRPAEVFLPSDWSADGNYPVVVLLHGLSASGPVQNAYFRTSALVDELQFVFVLPDGTTNSGGSQFWNATEVCCDFDNSGVDDSTYLSELAADAVNRYAGDPTRVYFMGHSNGGYMSYRLACDHSDQIAAIASLAGATWQDPANCGDPDPVAVLQIHGTTDATVPYDGRPNIHPGAEESVQRWVERNGCPADPTFVGTEDYDSQVAGAETELERWRECESGMAVALWRMEGSGHIPSIDDDMTRDILGFLFEHSR